ncbi:hypothetical protein Leryth_027331 [Lithospermum erythrorhizon]|nr:hypothetical protein Leryth_027331 [Lithospermum erythrorhizon]
MVLHFYPAVAGSNPVTLGEIEVLGASLPWRSIFTGEGPFMRLCSNINTQSTQTNPFLSGVDENPFAGGLSSNEIMSPEKAGTSSNMWVDLLTGEPKVSDSSSQPVMGPLLHQQTDLLDFLDDSDIHSQEPTDGRNSDSNTILQGSADKATNQYINCFKLIGRADSVHCSLKSLCFLEVDILL